MFRLLLNSKIGTTRCSDLNSPLARANAQHKLAVGRSGSANFVDIRRTVPTTTEHRSRRVLTVPVSHQQGSDTLGKIVIDNHREGKK